MARQVTIQRMLPRKCLTMLLQAFAKAPKDEAKEAGDICVRLRLKYCSLRGEN